MMKQQQKKILKVGVTGGIGSGKSVVCTLVKHLGYPVYDTDFHAKLVMHTSQEVREQLIYHFGEPVFEEGVLNRSYLANIVFQDSSQLQRLNQIVHPAVRKHFRSWCDSQNEGVVFIESAILFESGLSAEVDEVWLVVAPVEERVARVMHRDACDEQQVRNRIQVQLKDEEMERMVSKVIRNGSRDALLPQVEALLGRLNDDLLA